MHRAMAPALLGDNQQEIMQRAVPVLPESAPFTAEQRAWLNGFLAGLFVGAPEQGMNPPKGAGEPLLVLYGSQTGTAERLAREVAAESAQQGFTAKVLEMNACTREELANQKRVLIVTSTWGDGDPPDNAAQFWSLLNSAQAPSLESTKFAVFGLGDRNYPDFCGAGKKFDARLDQLGAKRLHPRIDSAGDHDSQIKTWMARMWPALKNGPVASATIDPSPTNAASKQFVAAWLIANRKLNCAGSAKDTRHIEISLTETGLEYEVGDVLGVRPMNCPGLVSEILATLGWDGEEAVVDSCGAETSLRNALLSHYEITRVPRALFEVVAERSRDLALAPPGGASNKVERGEWPNGNDILDLLMAYPVRFAAREFVQLLSPLRPRLYSISSSPKAHPGEVHLTVGTVRYQHNGRERKGVCSTYLADRVQPKSSLSVYLQPSPGFRLPCHGDTPIIMVGPGTGIAPFRAFLEERQALGARGRNWLFFGDQHFAADFLYREQLEAMIANKHLARLDTAFSRDQPEKLYVQHRILEQAKDVYAWLEEGAHFYVCGDARRMAKDVDAALHEVVQIAGGKTAEGAMEYVAALKRQKRYQRDVY
jgi:sulfite reductase (NADPH) flavoprotein alpha-component